MTHDSHDAGMTAWVMSLFGLGFCIGLIVGLVAGLAV